MVIVKEYPCENRRQAQAEEDRIMRQMRSSLNMLRAYQTTEERREYVKEYDKVYNERNKVKKKEQIKKNYEQNKPRILEQKKEHYELNKDKILEQKKEKINCACGCVVTKGCLARHKRSINHQTLINQQTEQ